MPLSNFGMVRPGRLYRCAQPDVTGLVTLASLGVGCVVSLNGAKNADWDREKWIEDLPTLSVDVPRVVALVDRINGWLNRDGSLAVHCTHGRDRTGLVIGAWRLRHDDWSFEEVQAERGVYGISTILEIAERAIHEALEQIAGMT